MGPALREHWLIAITWYPTRRTRSETMNEHVDARRYRARWLAEIRRIGGFENLTPERQNGIAAKLMREFRIERLA